MSYNLKETLTTAETKQCYKLFKLLLKEKPDLLIDKQEKSIDYIINNSVFINKGLVLGSGEYDAIFFPISELYFQGRPVVALCFDVVNGPCLYNDAAEGARFTWQRRPLLVDIIGLITSPEEWHIKRQLKTDLNRYYTELDILHSIQRVTTTNKKDFKRLDKNFKIFNSSHSCVALHPNGTIEFCKDGKSKKIDFKIGSVDEIFKNINNEIKNLLDLIEATENKLDCLHAEMVQVHDLAKKINSVLATLKNNTFKESFNRLLKTY